MQFELEQQSNVEDIFESKSKKVCTKSSKCEQKWKATPQNTNQKSKETKTVEKPEISTKNFAIPLASVSFDNLKVKPQNIEILLLDEQLANPCIWPTDIFPYSSDDMQDISKVDLFKKFQLFCFMNKLNF